MMASRRRQEGLPAPRLMGADPDEVAVSTVLGAVLMFGILVVTLVTVRVEFVPVWDEDREVRHMDTVRGQLAILKSDLDRQVDNRTDVPITNPLKLGVSGGFSFFSTQGLAGSVGVTEATEMLSMSSPRLTIQEQNGRSFYGLADPNDWLAVDNVDDTLTGVTAIRALRVRINMDPVDAYDEGDKTTMTITDVDGDPAGSATVTFRDFPSEQALETRIFNAAGQEVSSDLEAFFQQTALEYMYIDLLDQNLLFDAVLSAADGPLTLTLVDAGLEADYIVVYDAQTSGGSTTTVGSPGLVLAPYGPVEYAGGSLRFQGRNNAFVNQDYVLEHGAVIRVQDDGAAMIIPPLFSVTDADGQTVIEWTLPSLSGPSQQVSGTNQVSLLADPTGSRINIRATAYTLVFDIPTAYPAIWDAFLTRELRGAGYTENDEFTTTADADSVLVTIVGPDADNNILTAVDDIFLSFKQANIDIEIRSSG